MVSDAIPISFDYWTHGLWLSEKEYHIWDADSEHMHPSREPCLSPARHCHLASAVADPSKDLSPILENQFLSMVEGGGNMVKLMNSMFIQ